MKQFLKRFFIERPACGASGARRAFGGMAPWAALALLFCLHLSHNSVDLVRAEFWLDEATTYLVAVEPIPDCFQHAFMLHHQPPLFYLVAHGMLQVGDGEWFLRAFSWVCFLCVVAAFLFMARSVPPLARLAAAVYMVLHMRAAFLSQEFRPYAMAVLFLFLSTCFLLKLLESPRFTTALAYFLTLSIGANTLAFGVWTFFSQWVFFAAVVSARACTGRGFRGRIHPALIWGSLSICSAFATYWPYYHASSQRFQAQGNSGAWETLAAVLQPSQWARGFAILAYPFPTWTIEAYPAAGAAAVLVMAVFFVGLVYGLRRYAHAWLFALLVFGHLAFVFGFLHNRSFFAPRYLLPVFPVFVWVVGWGIQALFARREKWLALFVKVGVPSIAVICAAWAVWMAARPPRPSNWKELRAVVHALPGKKGVFFETCYQGSMFEYVVRKDPEILSFSRDVQGQPIGGGAPSLDYVRKALDGPARGAGFLFYCAFTGGPGEPFQAFSREVESRGYRPLGAWQTPPDYPLSTRESKWWAWGWARQGGPQDAPTDGRM